MSPLGVGGDVARQFPTFGIHHVVHQRDGAEGPEDQKRPGAFDRPTAEADLPIARRGGKPQARLLDLQEHGIKPGKIAQPDDEIEQLLVVLAAGIEPGVRQQLIEQRPGTFCFDGAEKLVAFARGKAPCLGIRSRGSSTRRRARDLLQPAIPFSLSQERSHWVEPRRANVQRKRSALQLRGGQDLRHVPWPAERDALSRAVFGGVPRAENATVIMDGTGVGAPVLALALVRARAETGV